MALNFTLVAPAEVEKVAKVRTFSDELQAEFTEAFMALSVAPKGSVLTVEFPDAETRNKWFDEAKAFGLTWDTPVRIQRVKGTESMSPNHGKLAFTMETVDEHTNRILKAKEKADTAPIRKWANENGHKVSERGRIPAHIIAAYDNRTV